MLTPQEAKNLETLLTTASIYSRGMSKLPLRFPRAVEAVKISGGTPGFVTVDKLGRALDDSVGSALQQKLDPPLAANLIQQCLKRR